MSLSFERLQQGDAPVWVLYEPGRFDQPIAILDQATVARIAGDWRKWEEEAGKQVPEVRETGKESSKAEQYVQEFNQDAKEPDKLRGEIDRMFGPEPPTCGCCDE